MPEDGFAALQADLHAALSRVINDHEDGASYLTRFVVLAEVVEDDGQRVLWTVAAEGMRRWDTLGLLEDARLREYTAAVRDEG
jgi:hypothetical protein